MGEPRLLTAGALGGLKAALVEHAGLAEARGGVGAGEGGEGAEAAAGQLPLVEGFEQALARGEEREIAPQLTGVGEHGALLEDALDGAEESLGADGLDDVVGGAALQRETGRVRVLTAREDEDRGRQVDAVGPPQLLEKGEALNAAGDDIDDDDIDAVNAVEVLHGGLHLIDGQNVWRSRELRKKSSV